MTEEFVAWIGKAFSLTQDMQAEVPAHLQLWDNKIYEAIDAGYPDQAQALLNEALAQPADLGEHVERESWEQKIRSSISVIALPVLAERIYEELNDEPDEDVVQLIVELVRFQEAEGALSSDVAIMANELKTIWHEQRSNELDGMARSSQAPGESSDREKGLYFSAGRNAIIKGVSERTVQLEHFKYDEQRGILLSKQGKYIGTVSHEHGGRIHADDIWLSAIPLHIEPVPSVVMLEALHDALYSVEKVNTLQQNSWEENQVVLDTIKEDAKSGFRPEKKFSVMRTGRRLMGEFSIDNLGQGIDAIASMIAQNTSHINGHLEKPLFFWHDNVFSSVTSLS